MQKAQFNSSTNRTYVNFPLQNLAPGNHRLYSRDDEVLNLKEAVGFTKFELELNELSS